MKPFRFNLEALLRLRESEKERAQGVLVQAMQQRRQAQAVIDAALKAKAVLGESMKAGRAHTFNVSSQQQLLLSQEGLSQHLMQARIEEQKRADAEAQARVGYNQARMQVEVLERLRERRRCAHEQTQARAEERQLEELANLRRAFTGRASLAEGGILAS
ncbi:MAG: hypothetical protein ACFBZ8_01475 [Opitutales bacterium]